MLAHPGKLKRTNFPASAMETLVESSKERDKKQKTCEASTEDRDFMGLTSGDQHGRIQANEFMNFHVFCQQLDGILYLNGSAAAAAIKPPAGGILDSSSSLVEAENESKREVDWSSLPALPLLKIMDRLDVFSNKRLTAVCRDWWSVSVRYPRKLYSVGDGEPWICHMKYGWESHTREFISVSKNRKFEVDMPEFAKSRVLFSNGGWLLLQNGGIFDREVTSWFLVNPFTRDKIELPNSEGGNNGRCCGSFKLGNGGRPDRVYLIIPEVSHQARINTAHCGDKEWTSHNFTGLDRAFLTLFSHVAIGDEVYCKDTYSYITVFNLSNNSVKVLPRVSSAGLITEYDGELIHVVVIKKIKEGSNSKNKKNKPRIVVRKYHDASSSWETLKHNPLMGRSWYLSDGQSSVISAEGGSSGSTKIYRLRQKVEKTRSERDCKYSYYYVSVRDLLTGKRKRPRVPFPNHRCPFWVAIG